ncbi:HAMP domain-containing sensor histidine kinase [Compostibacter hankyongensis]|uniref:histidine kinase n=1 Tax=Compostibacter hankyongensis TaxID=1007089 RepID=A0ABP8G9V0_9BACT
MRPSTLKKIIAAMTVLIILVMGAQLYWLKKTYTLEEQEFNVKVHAALRSVVESVRFSRKDTAPFADEVEQAGHNYYIANTKYAADSTEVVFLLKKAFEEYNVFTSFKFGLYRSSTGQMEDVGYIRSAPTGSEDSTARLTVVPKSFNYVGVLFPGRESFLLREMGFWIFSTILLLAVIIGFVISILKLFRQKQLSEVQKDFINNMTHEFRTPIATIQLSTEVLKNATPVRSDQRLSRYARIIGNEINHLGEQVERVLQVAKTEKHNIQLKKEPVDIHEVIRQCMLDFEAVLRRKKGHFHPRLEAAHPVLILDALHFKNILFNLIDNAIKYAPQPEITLTTADHRQGVSISVADNGIGIPRQYQQFLFTKFFRVPTGNLHEVKGFGLGLNYVKLYTKAMKGEVKMESDPGKGSIFTIWFPQGDPAGRKVRP